MQLSHTNRACHPDSLYFKKNECNSFENQEPVDFIYGYQTFKMSCRDLTTWQGTRIATPAIAAHDDVIKWKHFPCYWLFVPVVNSPHKGQWRWALMFSLICAWINHWVNNREAGDLRHYRAHYDVIVMLLTFPL